MPAAEHCVLLLHTGGAVSLYTGDSDWKLVRMLLSMLLCKTHAG